MMRASLIYHRRSILVQTLREIHYRDKKAPTLLSKLSNTKTIMKRSLQSSSPTRPSTTFAGKNLKQVPQDVLDRAESIKELDISNNQIQTLPVELKAIKRVNISNNPLLGIPRKFRTAPWAKVRTYLQKIYQLGERWTVRKLILIGDSKDGKTVCTLSPFELILLTRN